MIRSKYIYHFFTIFRKLICNTLSDKDVVEHNFKEGREWAQGTTHNYIMRDARVRKAKRSRRLCYYNQARICHIANSV
ncbi:hypothetical protein HMPREF9447_04580 [Bacteroides oleiciplenus YIT 12058]|uniref:Uncharacterized protein n=1 Tax=Bacteroides oleiciplenus YIT 12058 TaxID=742727 RepID=K9DSI8_9BACE|nr:hypothetical protein HMPREF9447_04580 [Bacteroides oleiciplenus YIT 12058]